MKKELLELYSDYLLSSFGYTTAAGLSDLPDKQIGHDRITDFLAGSDFNSGDLWLPAYYRTKIILNCITDEI